ncbi:MAG: glycosyltransferase [Candidatus Binataceae bacterium]
MIRVSSVIPVFNGERTIRAAIDSVLAQEFDGQEAIVVDDGSTDATPAILAGYGDRIRVLTQPNRGVAAARNAGVRASRGEYLAFLDSDDQWLPGRLARTFAALAAAPSAVMAFADVLASDGQGKLSVVRTGPAPSMKDLLTALTRMQCGTWLVRRTAFERCGGFAEEFKGCGGEDSWMLLLLREQGEFVYVDEPLLRYSTAAWSVIGAKYDYARAPLLRMLRERYGRRSKALRIDVSRCYASSYFQRSLEQLERGDRRGAARSLLSSVRSRPTYLFESGAAIRMLNSSNLQRLYRFILPARQ